jgi:hypothetical protein
MLRCYSFFLLCGLSISVCAANVIGAPKQQRVITPTNKAISTTDSNSELGTYVTVLTEDFSLLTDGSESAPATASLEDDDLNIPSNKTHVAGWKGYNLHEAGGAIYLACVSDETGALSSPYFDVSKGEGSYNVSFRAKSAIAGETDKLYVDSKLSTSVSVSKDVKLTDQWQSFELTFENGSSNNYILFYSVMDAILLDDIKVEMLVPFIASPKNVSFSNYLGNGFDLKWDAVADAKGYSLCIYTKDGDGNRTYALKDIDVKDTQYSVANLPDADTFYFVSIKAYNDNYTSAESAELAVEALLTPVLNDETDLSATGFTASWNTIAHASSYDFISRFVHTASADETFTIVEDNFDSITESGRSKYDYTSVKELPGWTIASATFLPGEVGVYTANSNYGTDAWMRSPIYDLTNGDGNVKLKMNLYANHKKYTAKVVISMFTYDEKLGYYKEASYVTIDALNQTGLTDYVAELTGGGKQSIISIAPTGYASMMVKDLSLTMQLPSGKSIDVPAYTSSVTQPSATVSNLKISSDDKVYYYVRAVGRNSRDTGNIYSEYTENKYVTLPTSYISPITNLNNGNDVIEVYNLSGIKVLKTSNRSDIKNLPSGIYIANGEKILVR